MIATLNTAALLKKANFRLCRLRSWSDYNGFGFRLKPPHIIDLIEPYSPAAATGLQQFDIVLAIDRQNTVNLQYKEIIDLIRLAKERNGTIELLVIEEEFYYQLKKKNILFDEKHASVIETPQNMPNNYENYFKHQPRTCELFLGKHDTLFGFHVEINGNGIGAFISALEPNTPASRSILRVKDRIIEINDQRYDKEGEKVIFQKLQRTAAKRYVKLYVMDNETYNYYKKNKVSLSAKKFEKEKYHFTKRFNRTHRASVVSSVSIPDEDNRIDRDLSSDDDNNNRVSTISINDEPIHVPLQTFVENGTIAVRKKSSQIGYKNKYVRAIISVCKGDLVTQQTDVIVVCSTSKYLFNSICQAGGSSLSDSYDIACKRSSSDSVIAVRGSGQLASKWVYFVAWQADKQSIETVVSDAIERAVKQNCRTIAFPAIGCGQHRCSLDSVAQAMIKETDRLLSIHNMSVTFVIQPDRTDIYNVFQKQIQVSVQGVETISVTAGKGIIEIEQGDLTMQEVDVIIGSSSSQMLMKAIIQAAGSAVERAYLTEYKNNPDSILIVTPPGTLHCKRIFFLKWEPTDDEKLLQQSLMDFILIVIQSMKSHKFTSIAFPAIGCGEHGCSMDIVVEALVKGMKTELVKRNLPWLIKFVIQPDQTYIYDQFCRQMFAIDDDLLDSSVIQYPSTWEKAKEGILRYVVSIKSDEYQSIVSKFDQAMQGKYTQIVRIERIQNERCYAQYIAHWRDFKKRLGRDTERRLYHGCPEKASESIISSFFNRNFAGVNGTVYGIGAYFSTDASYSHGFTSPNANGERCMFVVRVLVGKTTLGDNSMKNPPEGFDSTTDDKHIFVTYHDAQALAEYLITYE